MQHDHDRLKLYLTHRSALVDYVTPLAGGSRAQAEDIVQEAYFRFVPQDGAGPATIAEKPLAYLYRIVRNLAFDWMRRKGAEGRRDTSHAVLSDVARVQPSPEEELQHRDDLRIVAAVLVDLPAPMRQAFEMQRFGGLSFQQIGAKLGVSPASAHRLAQAALVEIMRRLQGPRRKS